MTFRVRTEQRATGLDLDSTIWLLEDDQGAGAEIWPAHGFNCYRWHTRNGRELLYAAADFFDDPRPSRSGIPVLFPFPNRIAAGRFVWEGKEYRLPLNDPTERNAIHGFACRHSWRVVDQGSSDVDAWLTGEFHAARDAPETLVLWPADHRIRLTYRLGLNSLHLDISVDNPQRRPLPFGLGFHPYFRLPDATIQVPANAFWELHDNLPTGRVLPVDGTRDLREGRNLEGTVLDDVLTDLVPRGTLTSGVQRLTLGASPEFREMVVFTPPHRQAVCLEPYTCTTDAINLQSRGIDAGWQVLDPDQNWTAIIHLDAAM